MGCARRVLCSPANHLYYISNYKKLKRFNLFVLMFFEILRFFKFTQKTLVFYYLISFLLSSIIFKMQSRLVVRSWAIARMSLIVKEDKSSMKNFIESPSFPELSKQARKTNESKERSIQDGQPLYQRPYIFNIA